MQLGIIYGLVAMLAAGFALGVASRQDREDFKAQSVTATEFILVDGKGQRLAWLGSDLDGSTGVDVFAPGSGGPDVSIRCSANRSSLTVGDPNGGVVALTSENGTSSVTLSVPHAQGLWTMAAMRASTHSGSFTLSEQVELPVGEQLVPGLHALIHIDADVPDKWWMR